MKPADLITFIDMWLDWFPPCGHCPSLSEHELRSSIQIDEERWREDVDAAIERVCLRGDKSDIPPALQFYTTWRLLYARRWLCVADRLIDDLPFEQTARELLIHAWPSSFLPLFLEAVVAFRAQSDADA